MSLGHGQPGLLDRLRTFADLMADSGAERRPYLECRFGQALGSWVHDGSNVYRTSVTAASVTHLGIIRAIVGVESMVSPWPLTRVERQADVVAGTWYYDDDALVAGGSTNLYVKLPDSSNPSSTTVMALLSFPIGAVGEVLPLFGPEKYGNADLESWPGGNPADWIEIGAGVTQETTIVASGSSSARVGTTVGSLALDGIQQTKVAVQGAMYRIGAYYQTLAANAPEVEARLRVGINLPSRLMSDGRNLTTDDAGFRVRDTYGEWRTIGFDYLWSGATTTSCEAFFGLKNTVASVKTASLYIDRMFWRRIYRFALFESRLAAASIPELEIASQSALFGAKTIGMGSVTLIDGDGEMAKALAQLLILHKPAFFSIGGTFSNGEELYRHDHRGAFPARTRKPTFTDGEISFELEDSRTLSRAQAAPNGYRAEDFPNLATRARGKTKALIFGATDEFIIPGTRVDVNANGFGKYEALDPLVPVVEGVAVDLPSGYGIKTFPNEELANHGLKGYEHSVAITSSSVANPTVITTAAPHYLATGNTIVISGHGPSTPSINGTHVVTVTGDNTFTIPVNVTSASTGGKLINTADFTVDTQNTRWNILRDLRDMRLDRGGNDVGTNAAFWFTTELGTHVARVNLEGPAYKNAAKIQAAMRTAVGGSDTQMLVSVDESTHKWTIARSGSKGIILSLLMTEATGDREAHKQSYKLLGFDPKQDLTGATTYTGDNPTFADADSDHIVRFRTGGYKDDASGSICGTASAPIDTPPAAYSWIAQKVLHEPASMFNIPSFASARDAAQIEFAILFMHLENEEDAFQAFADLGQAGTMDVVQDGDGIYQCKKYAAGSTGAREFGEKDFLPGFRMWKDPEMVHKAVRLHGGYNPSLKQFTTWGDGAGVIDSGIALKHGTDRVLEINSYLSRAVIAGGLQLTANYYARLVGKVPWFVEFHAAGRLTDLLVGDKVKLTRSRPVVLSSTAFRILGLRHNFLTGISRCTAVEDVQFLT